MLYVSLLTVLCFEPAYSAACSPGTAQEYYAAFKLLSMCHSSYCRYDIYTFSRPHHPLAFLGYPVVRVLQQQFRQQSMRAVARAAAVHVVDSSLDDTTKKRLELFESEFVKAAGNSSKKKGFGVFGGW